MNIPSVALLAMRYESPRTLRTRATGTPFRVVLENDELVIIPGSGNHRRVDRAELRRAWPLIAAGATRTALKAVSNNSSYLDAVYDDVRLAEVAETPAHREAGPVPAESADTQLDDGSGPASISEAVRLKARLAQADLRVAHLETENAAQRDRFFAAEARLVDLERVRPTKVPDEVELETTIQRLRKELLAATNTRRDVERQLEAVRDRLQDTLTRQPRDALHLTLKIDKHIFDSKHPFRTDLRDTLYEAGQLAFRFPSGSVASSRRAIESAVGYLWRQATSGVGTPKVADMLEDLRGHRLMPITDWHLAKNLYGRASAIVHDGTKRPDLALWIFFGAVQICELVQDEDNTGQGQS